MVKIKICGITNKEDALAAAKAGADFLGFNFFEKSKRFIEPEKARKILSALPHSVKAVGVFVNAPVDEVNEIADSCKLDFVQLHGNESQDYCSLIKKPVIKVFRIKDENSFVGIESFVSEFVLLDAFSETAIGGTGKQIEEKFFSRIKLLCLKRKVFLSGGLTPENVSVIVKQLNPFVVDVASGVEISPGKKDAEKIARFVLEAKK
jgi:phosphoribosylanthranilate isomerase